jgi:hypothetical protein
MARITEWPLSPWSTLNLDVLNLSEPRGDEVAYTRGYLTIAGILNRSFSRFR